ncbi:hypothetical protein AAFC00_002188 [Neodothiora populina]|uniref:Uncharacterized protein n=1 Tax=Neodothiora populina TaxID=2781224 RepID=A0ABR3PGM4_9PEZI
MTRRESLVIEVIRSSINIFISPAGDGKLFSGTAALLHAENAMEDIDIRSNYSMLVLFVIHVSSQVGIAAARYYLGHVLPVILITSGYMTPDPSTIYYDRRSRDELKSHQYPPIRNLRRTTTYMRKIYGTSMVFRGLKAAILYQLAQSAVSWTVGTLTRQHHPLLENLAYIASCVILTDLHLHWTWRTVAVGRVSKQRRREQQQSSYTERWKALAPLTLAYAVGTSVSHSLNSWTGLLGLSSGSDSVGEAYETSRQDIVSAITARETFLALSALLLRIFVVLPCWICLLQAETRFFPEGQRAVVPRSLPVEQSAPTAGIMQSRLGEGRLDYGVMHEYTPARRSVWLGLVELHLKKCVLHLFLQGLLWLMAAIFLYRR